MRSILCNVCQPISILVARVWRRKLDYTKILQVRYFTGENIPIYGILWARHYVMSADSLVQTPPSFFFPCKLFHSFLAVCNIDSEMLGGAKYSVCISEKLGGTWGRGYCIDTMELFFPYIVHVHLASLISNNVNV